MKNHNRRDQRRRALVHAYEAERRVYKALSSDMGMPTPVRRRAMLALTRLPRSSSPVRIQNRCVLTGRARGVETHFQLSRLCLREAATQGLLPGVFKASW